MLKLDTLRVELDVEAGRLTLRDAVDGARLVVVPTLAWLTPVLDGQPADWRYVRQSRLRDTLTLFFDSATCGDATLTLTAAREAEAFDVQCAFTALADTQLNRLELCGAGTQLNLHEVINYRNRHHTSATWPELSLHGCETNTYSGDWQFAPHPTMLLFGRATHLLFAGTLDLPKSFGMYLSVDDYTVREWYLDYGAQPWGQPLAAGERFLSPRVRFFYRRDEAVEDCLYAFGNMLVDAKVIADPERKRRQAWWTEPLYCTWIDQCFLADTAPPYDLADQNANTNQPSRRVLNEALVRRAVEVLQREELPVRTILLDEGWNVARGQWEPHPARFPDLRALVDELHAGGFKVVVWWNWAEIEPAAQVDPAHLLAGGRPNKHGAIMRDYSLRATQEEYLQPLFRQLFSSAPGCYDLDGVKTDFLADKVHADMPVADPAWRGEENYFLQLTRLFYRELKRHKRDAVHIGCAGNYHLAEWIDINRTYDVCTSNWLEHEERASMLFNTTPGCPVAYDFHNFVDGLADWFDSAADLGAAVQLGNVLHIRDDQFSPARPADAAYFELLREKLRPSG